MVHNQVRIFPHSSTKLSTSSAGRKGIFVKIKEWFPESQLDAMGMGRCRG
jgi:hypothetical protein